jgi:DNA helicase-2/ATP-dependent DNA helicase PcrA
MVTAPGPLALGRGVVMLAGKEVPTLWADAPVVVVDGEAAAAPGGVVARLHAAWAGRQPVVVAVGVDPASFRDPRSYPVEPWTLDTTFEAWHDRLTFLVWANNYDARGAGAPVWWWGRKASRLGAVEGGQADVVLPDGRPAWIDGGPRRPLGPPDIDEVLVHCETVDVGRLETMPGPRPPAGEFVADLAPDQLAAVAHGSGPARIIAPAGSGKTRVLSERLRQLVVDRAYDRETVLAVAYNVKAREEMVARTALFAPRIQSLNALGYSLLRQAYPRGEGPRVLDEREVRDVVERVMPRRQRRTNVDPYAVYLEGLSTIRLGLRDPAEVEESLDEADGLAAGFGPFRAALAEAGAVDFDEQIYGAIELLLHDGRFRRDAQRGCRHLLVDEFQDLTPAHVLLIRLLAAPGLDVFGVGDDDQVIYGHAGADPAFLIGFESLFPGAVSHPLEVNYRCPVPVVEAARTLLSYNHRRVAKTIVAGPLSDGSPTTLEVRQHGPGDGAREVVSIVQGWLKAPAAVASDVAVLARVNSLLLAPHVALVEAGVPVDSVVGPELLRRTGVRAALAYLRIGAEPDAVRGADVVEVMRRPSRALAPWFAERIGRRAKWTLAGLGGLVATVPDKDQTKVAGLVDDLAGLAAVLAGGDTGAALAYTRDVIGLGRAMSLLDGGRQGSSNLDDLDGLAQVAALHPDPDGFEPWLRELLERPREAAGVTLSTIHRVKGREWPSVVVFGVTDGILPHRLADDEEEERRVLHVAITRCRARVVVLGDKQRRSPFLAELSGQAPHRPPRPRGRPAVSPSTVPVTRREALPAPDLPPLPPEGERREAALRAWRTDKAKQDQVSAFIVLTNRVLRAVAILDPQTLAELAGVGGFGPSKLDRYGDEILALLGSLRP